VGKTTLSVNLSIALQRRTGKRVALFDADLFCGNVGTYLNLPPVHSIADLTRVIDELEPDLVDRVLIRHSSGVRVLLSPPRPDQAFEITREQVSRILQFLAQHEDYLVVDCLTFVDERILPILEQADDIVLITMPEMGSLKNMRTLFDHMVNIGLDLNKVHIVLNRANSKVAIGAEQIEQAFGRKVEFRLSGGGSAVALSINRGVPLVLEQPSHPLSREIMGMAEYFSQDGHGKK
jgi:pilus assembly protein CpaE